MISRSLLMTRFRAFRSLCEHKDSLIRFDHGFDPKLVEAKAMSCGNWRCEIRRRGLHSHSALANFASESSTHGIVRHQQRRTILRAHAFNAGLSDFVERIILASMSALLSPVQDGKIWRVLIVWPNGAVRHFGKFTSEKKVGWIDAHRNLTEPVAENAKGDPHVADRSR
jgi:hypothetical protein